ncbi:MAG: sulfatase-like hydrolase/transferase [Planctomycetota bacterium]|nr:sulfatase-like hydrolase/transferase [Planctomycetota bacterium]
MNSMLKRWCGYGWVLAISWLVLSAELQAAEKNAKPPNILFVFADDQAFNTIAALGNQEIRTPHLDRIVQDGMTFTHTFNQGSWSGAVCVASRCMLNTGRFLWNANRIYGQTEKERQAGRFWSEHLKKAGYETYMTGKWHVRADATKAFDRAGHVRGGMPNQTPEGYNRPRKGQPDPWKPWDEKFGGFWKGGKHWSEVVGDDAVSFLEQAAKSESPFFMYLAFNAPHDPRQSPKRFVDMYPLDKIAVPRSYVPEYPFKEAMGSGVKLRDEKLAPFPRTEHAVKVNRQEYYAIITHMDQQIGRIMEALKKSGKADNTYIFFTADHGLAVGHHGLMGKQNMFDHSVRVPFVVIGPGIAGGTRSDAWIYLQDVMPTTLELAGIKKPGHVQFKSLLPLIKGETRKGYDAVYGAYLALQRSVREGPYKLILYPKIAQQVLYNVEQDPLELKDLAGDAKYLEVKKKLFARLLELQQQTGDKLELTTTFADLQ